MVVTPANGSASLQWQPPTDPGTSPITGYVITAQPYANSDYYANPQTVTADVSGTGTGKQDGEITGLLMDCHQEYTFTVSAVNAAGTGPPSDYGAALHPDMPSPPDASGSPPHFRPSGIVEQSPTFPPPVVAVTVDGFGAQYFLDRKGNPRTITMNPLEGASSTASFEAPVSYCMEGEQSGALPNANASVPDAIWEPDEHFDQPGGVRGLTPGFVNGSGQYVDTHHYLLDQIVESGGVALPYSYTAAAKLSLSAGVPRFTFTGYTVDKSRTQDPSKDVKLLAGEIDSINRTWPNARIVLLGHSGGGLVVEQYWQHFQYQSHNVELVVSTEGPINGTFRASECSPDCPSAFDFGDKVLNFLGQQWDNQQQTDADIRSRNSDGSFVAISTEGDSAYGFATMGLFDSIVPDSIFGCDVTSDPSQVNSCQPAQPPSFVDGGQWRAYDPCQWTNDLQQAIGVDASHEYAIVCREDVDYVRQALGP